MRQVTKEEFFAPINSERLDVHPRIINGRYPYTAIWLFPRKPGRPAYGKTVGRIKGGGEVTDYFLADSAEG